MKTISNLLVLTLLSIGLIGGLVELALFINKAFTYFLCCGLSILVVLGAFEILERAK
jgi:hypothetical protein